MLEIRKLHDCQLPNMQSGTKTVLRKTGFFKREPVEVPTYSRETYARFTCNECKSVWNYRPVRLILVGEDPETLQGHWICQKRTEEWEYIRA